MTFLNDILQKAEVWRQKKKKSVRGTWIAQSLSSRPSGHDPRVLGPGSDSDGAPAWGSRLSQEPATPSPSD